MSKTPLSTYLEIPLLVIMVQMSIHSRPRLVINCQPLAPKPSPTPPDCSPSSCYMFTETTSQHQLHCLIQLEYKNFVEIANTNHRLLPLLFTIKALRQMEANLGNNDAIKH